MAGKGRLFSVDRETISLKATLFLFYGAMYAILPYLTIHMIEIGLSIEEIGIIYAALPFASFAGPPIAGMIADYIGKYKPVLYISLFFNGLFYTLLLLVDAKGSPPLLMANSTLGSLECYGNTTRVSWNTCDGTCNVSELTMTVLLDTCKIECLDNVTDEETKCLSDDCLRNKTDMTFFVEDITGDGNCSGEVVSKYEYFEHLLCACSTKCDVQLYGINCDRNISLGVPDPNHNHPYYDESVHVQGFWLYFVLRMLATIFTGINFSMLDSTTLCKVRETGGQYGRQRVWATLGSAIASPLTGGLVDLISDVRGFEDYSITFYISDLLLVFTIISLLKVDLLIDKSDEPFSTNVKRLMKFPDVDVFIFMMFVLGTLWGFIESFLFIFLKDLSAPTYLLGLTVTVSCMVGLPFMYCSEWIIDRVGKINMIILAFFTYAVRLVGYSFINNPWLCFPFEIMEVVTQHLMAIACATFCSSTAPIGLLATMTGLVGGAHYNIGRGAGSFLGGFFISEHGLRMAFQLMGAIAAVSGVVYGFLQICWLRRYEKSRSRERAIQEKQGTDEISNVPERFFNGQAKYSVINSDDSNRELRPLS